MTSMLLHAASLHDSTKTKHANKSEQQESVQRVSMPLPRLLDTWFAGQDVENLFDRIAQMRANNDPIERIASKFGYPIHLISAILTHHVVVSSSGTGRTEG